MCDPGPEKIIIEPIRPDTHLITSKIIHLLTEMIELLVNAQLQQNIYLESNSTNTQMFYLIVKI